MPASPAARRGPFITANRVTLARLVLLPVGTWMLYQGTVDWQVAALVFMTLVGCTDFVDGYLARKHGPTVLGGLMDPIADKVFIAVTFLPFLDLDWMPLSVVLAIFLREFVITAARTTYERRQVTLKSSYLAKVKTWFQMVSVGLVFLLRVSPAATQWLGLAVFLGPGVIATIVVRLVLKRRWRAGPVFVLCFGLFWLATLFVAPRPLSLGIQWATVAITWYSGLEYLAGIRELRGKGLDIDDLIRLFGAVALPVLGCLLLERRAIPAWPIVVTFSLEFAIGGLDNLVAHLEQVPHWQGWALRVVPQALCLGGALLVLGRWGSAPWAPWVAEALTIAALAVTAISVLIAFWRRRHVYLGGRAHDPLAIESTG